MQCRSHRTKEIYGLKEISPFPWLFKMVASAHLQVLLHNKTEFYNKTGARIFSQIVRRYCWWLKTAKEPNGILYCIT